MKKINGHIDSIPIYLFIPETSYEFKEGARLFENNLEKEYGILFNFGYKQKIAMENSGVLHDLYILYFHKLSNSKYGVVQEIQSMPKNTYGPYTSTGAYPLSLELRADFCKEYNIKAGSILILEEALTQ